MDDDCDDIDLGNEEDSKWIEYFCCGIRDIVLICCGNESCAHNGVLSEATCAEMVLDSVGQTFRLSKEESEPNLSVDETPKAGDILATVEAVDHEKIVTQSSDTSDIIPEIQSILDNHEKDTTPLQLESGGRGDATSTEKHPSLQAPDAEQVLPQQSEQTIQVGNAPEIQEDDINEEPSSSSMANLESKSEKDSQEEDNTPASVGITTDGTPVSHGKGDSTCSEPSHVTATNLGIPISFSAVKTSELQLIKIETNSVKKPEEQNRLNFAAMSRNDNVWSGATDPVIVREKSVKEYDTSDCTMEQTTYNEKSVDVVETVKKRVETEFGSKSSIGTQQITRTSYGCEKLARKPKVHLRSSQAGSSQESAQENSSVESAHAYSSEDSEDNRDVEEEEVEDDYLMRTPRKSAVLDMCYELREKPELICHQLAKECLGEERYKFLMETNPQSTLRYSDTHGLAIIFWTPPRQDRKLLSTDKLKIKLEAAAGQIRNQLLHRLCWAYVVCDLISSSLVLHGWVEDYIQLCPHYLCDVIEPDSYGKNVPEDADINDEKTHSCYGSGLEASLLYVKKFGIPKAKAEKFNCNLKRPSDPDEERYNKITKVFRYHSLGEALLRLRTHTVGATLVLYEGWDRPFSIYRGPVNGAKYKGLHNVVMIDCRECEGKELVVRCKSSNGETIGTNGYIYVSLEVMFTVVGSSRKSQNLCSKRPEHLLSEFYSIDMEDGPLGLQFDRKRSRLMEANEYNVVEKDEKTNEADGSQRGNPMKKIADSPSIHGKVVNNHIQKTLLPETFVEEKDAKRSQIVSAGSSTFSLEESKSQSDIIPRNKSGVDWIKKKDISMDSEALERKAFFDRFKPAKPDEDDSHNEL